MCDDIARAERALAEEGRYSGGLATFLGHLALAWARLWGTDDTIAPPGARADADALFIALTVARNSGSAVMSTVQADDDEANAPFNVEILQLAIAEVERVRG